MYTTDERRRNNPRRPVVKHKFDKQLINIQVTTNASQSNTTLITMTYPCVIMGLIVNGTSSTVVAAVNIPYNWVVTCLEQGDTTNNIAFNGTMYAPEQNVMAYGSGLDNTGSSDHHYIKTKTGRKMRAGDSLVFSVASLTANAMSHNYTVQFFTKV